MNRLQITIMSSLPSLNIQLLILMPAIHQKWQKKIPSDDMSGLEPIVVLAKDARVMLTMNLWSTVGLCNGATGKVVDIIFQNNHQPPDLPIAVIIEFENYTGPVFDVNKPFCVPICPITVRNWFSRAPTAAFKTRLGFNNSQEPRTDSSKSLDRYW